MTKYYKTSLFVNFNLYYKLSLSLSEAKGNALEQNTQQQNNNIPGFEINYTTPHLAKYSLIR